MWLVFLTFLLLLSLKFGCFWWGPYSYLAYMWVFVTVFVFSDQVQWSCFSHFFCCSLFLIWSLWPLQQFSLPLWEEQMWILTLLSLLSHFRWVGRRFLGVFVLVFSSIIFISRVLHSPLMIPFLIVFVYLCQIYHSRYTQTHQWTKLHINLNNWGGTIGAAFIWIPYHLFSRQR